MHGRGCADWLALSWALAPHDLGREGFSRRGPLWTPSVQTVPGDLHDVLNEHDRDALYDIAASFVGSATARRRIA